jgi:Holliday junction resolvasome RuvABC endonuclease subunit
MKIIALDLGTNTGWATNLTGSVESGVQTFDIKRGESPGMRYVRFNRWLEELAEEGPDLIIFEQAHNRGGAATELLNGMATRVLELCAKRGVQHTSIHSQSLKKWATGSGNAKKPEMISAIKKTYPLVEDDNEADALHMLNYAVSELDCRRTYSQSNADKDGWDSL